MFMNGTTEQIESQCWRVQTTFFFLVPEVNGVWSSPRKVSEYGGDGIGSAPGNDSVCEVDGISFDVNDNFCVKTQCLAVVAVVISNAETFPGMEPKQHLGHVQILCFFPATGDILMLKVSSAEQLENIQHIL